MNSAWMISFTTPTLFKTSSPDYWTCSRHHLKTALSPIPTWLHLQSLRRPRNSTILEPVFHLFLRIRRPYLLFKKTQLFLRQNIRASCSNWLRCNKRSPSSCRNRTSIPPTPSTTIETKEVEVVAEVEVVEVETVVPLATHGECAHSSSKCH